MIMMSTNWVSAVNPSTSRPCTFKKTTEYLLSADCSARGLDEVPGDLPEDVTSLNLNGNNITMLTNVSFVSYSALRVLSLESNGLRNIQKGVFYPLVYLEELILERNNITCLLNDIFGRNKNLKLVQLSSNNFTSIPIRAFASLQTLNLIFLNHNPIRRLNFSGFSLMNLSILDLQFLEISSVQINEFSPLKEKTIHSVDLSGNNLTHLPDGVFQYLNCVTRLDLSCCSINNLTLNSFLGMESLEALYVEQSKVKWITGFSESFNKSSLSNPPLKNLSLSGNRIPALTSNVFSGLDKLIFLDLSLCKIKHIDNDTFQGLISLNSLDLSSNDIDSVYAKTFSHLLSLHELKLSSNKIQTLNPAMFCNSTFTYLDLSRNHITRINTGFGIYQIWRPWT